VRPLPIAASAGFPLIIMLQSFPDGFGAKTDDFHWNSFSFSMNDLHEGQPRTISLQEASSDARLANFLVTYELSIVRRLQRKGRQNGQKSFWNNAVSFVEQPVPLGY